MADITTEATQDVSIQDNDTGTYAGVNSNNEILSHDADVLEQAVEIEGNTRDIHHYQEAGEAFYITYAVTLANKDTEYDVILITNPNGSGADFEIQNVDVSVISMASGNFAKVRMYGQPTITANGTALSQYNAKIGDVTTSSINTFYLPTISARGNLLSYQASQLTSPFRIEHWLGTGIEPNNSMLFTMEATANGSILQITIKYVTHVEI